MTTNIPTLSASETTADVAETTRLDALSALLESLSNAVAPAGMEKEMRTLIMDKIRDHVTDLHVDSMGNITAIRRSANGVNNSNMPRLMIVAHMDEPGFIITEIADDGLITVEGMGNFDLRYTAAARVQLGKDKIPGVFTWKPMHHDRGMDLHAVEDSAIDVGASSSSGTGLQPGDRGVFLSTYQRLNESGFVRGKALISRIGCTALIDLITQNTLDADFSVAFVTQHTIHARGAGIAAFRLGAERALVLTGVEAFDLPRDENLPETFGAVHVGAGAVLQIGERSHLSAMPMRNILESFAAQERLPLQKMFAAQGSGAVSVTDRGIAAVTLGIPVRYASSPNSVAHLGDLETLIQLIGGTMSALIPRDSI